MRPKYLGYIDFSPGPGVSYREYLQAREFSDGIQFSIDEQTRALIDRDNKLLQQIEVVSSGIGTSVVRIQNSIADFRQSFEQQMDDLISEVRFGFAQTIYQLSRVNDNFDELLFAAKNPVRVRALEQYQIASDNYRRSLIPEALEALEVAINGNQSGAGYPTEFRFHLLKGVILLGDGAGTPQEIIEPAAAENCFLAAARYAQHDDPPEAANALLLAARAAYVRADHAAAERHLRQSLAMDYRGDRQFFLAKILACQNRHEEAVVCLEKAIRNSSVSAVLMYGEKDFEIIRDLLDRLVRSLQEEVTTIARNASHWVSGEVEALILERQDFPDGPPLLLKETCHEEIREVRSFIVSDRARGDIAGAVSSLEAIALDLPELLNALMNEWKARRLWELSKRFQKYLKDIDSNISTSVERRDSASGGYAGCLIFVGCVIFQTATLIINDYPEVRAEEIFRSNPAVTILGFAVLPAAVLGQYLSWLLGKKRADRRISRLRTERQENSRLFEDCQYSIEQEVLPDVTQDAEGFVRRWWRGS